MSNETKAYEFLKRQGLVCPETSLCLPAGREHCACARRAGDLIALIDRVASDGRALTVDAPALLAARIEGLKEAREITSAGHFRTKVAETPGDAIVFHIQQTRADIDRRIAELSSQEAGT